MRRRMKCEQEQEESEELSLPSRTWGALGSASRDSACYS